MIGAIIVNEYQFKSKGLNYFEINNRSGELNNIFKEFKKLTGYQFDNRHQYYSNIYGDLFSFGIYITKVKGINKYWSLKFWNSSGQDAIIEVSQDFKSLYDKISNDNLKLINDKLEQYSKGKIDCSECKTTINKIDIAGKYYAGVFCKNCWESKWKAIEAKESYD